MDFFRFNTLLHSSLSILAISYVRWNMRHNKKLEMHYIADALQGALLCKHCFHCTVPRKSWTTRKFTVQVVSSRGSTMLRNIKSPREKLWSSRGVSRWNTKRPRDPSFPAQCRSAVSRLDCTLKHSRNLVIASNLTYIYQCSGS